MDVLEKWKKENCKSYSWVIYIKITYLNFMGFQNAYKYLKLFFKWTTKQVIWRQGREDYGTQCFPSQLRWKHAQ